MSAILANPKAHFISFPEAIAAVKAGKTITKSEWSNAEIIGALRTNRLQWRDKDGTWHDWIINDGDIMGDDWMVI